MTTTAQITGFLISLLLSFTVAGLGGMASIDAGEFYAALTQPSWAPPAWLFGPVWTILYILMAVASWLVWRVGGFTGSTRLALSLYLVQLGFNALWSWLFFKWHLGLLAFINIAVLWICLVGVIILFRKISMIASLLILPYIAWVSFAAALNYNLWRLNPGVLA